MAPEGTGSPMHLHHHEDEAWYVIDGQVAFSLGENHNTSPAPAPSSSAPARSSTGRGHISAGRFLLFVTPAGFEDFTRTCGHPATSPTMPPPDMPPKDFQQLMDAARAHGLEIVGS